MKASHIFALAAVLISTNAKASTAARITGTLETSGFTGVAVVFTSASAQVNLTQTTSDENRPFITKGTLDKSMGRFETRQMVNGTPIGIVATRPPFNVRKAETGPIFKSVKRDVVHFKQPDKFMKVVDKSRWNEEFAVGFIFQGTMVRGAVNCESEARWILGSTGDGIYIVEKNTCNLDLETNSVQELSGESVRDLHKFILHRMFYEMS